MPPPPHFSECWKPQHSWSSLVSFSIVSSDDTFTGHPGFTSHSLYSLGHKLTPKRLWLKPADPVLNAVTSLPPCLEFFLDGIVSRRLRGNAVDLVSKRTKTSCFVCTTGSRTSAGIRLFYLSHRYSQLVEQNLSRKCECQHSGSADPLCWWPLDLHRYHWLFWACPNTVWGCFRLEGPVGLGFKVPWMWQDAVSIPDWLLVISQTWRHTSPSEPATSNKLAQLKSTHSLIVGWSQTENPEWEQLFPLWS